jgi:hypothetical protein
MKAILLCGWGANHSEPLQISSPCRRAACWISVDLTRAAEGEEAVAGGCLGDAWSFVEAGLADIPWTESVARGVPFASGIQAWCEL